MKNQNTFKKKIFQNGSYSIFISLAVVVILVVVNLLIGTLPTNITNIDLSEQQMFSISDQTKKVLDGLDTDVTVYFVAQSGNEDSVISEILEKYEDMSEHINVKAIDPGVNPAFASNYTTDGISDNSLVVESAKRFQVIAKDSIYVTTTSYDSEGNEVSSTSFNGESALTSAIDYVTSDTLPKAYNLVGHSEMVFSDTLASYIAKENIEVVDLSLATSTEVPEDCACLIINGPEKDVSESEAEAIADYLEDGGHLLYIKNYQSAVGTRLDNLVAEYGITVENYMVFEADSSFTFNNYPNMIIPNYREHTVTAPLIENMMYCLVPNALRLSVGTEAEALLSTTTSGYAKDLTQEFTSVEKTTKDKKGACVLAAAYEGSPLMSGEKTQIVVISSMDFLDAEVSSYVADGNYDFVINSIGWMCEHGSSIAIHSKNLGSDAIYLSSSQANLWTVLLMGIIPLAIIVTGIVIWVIRRRR